MSEQSRRDLSNPVALAARMLGGREVSMVLDVGAYDGRVGRGFAREFPSAMVHCFEPFGESFALLQKAASAEPRLRAHRLAVADVTGQRALLTNGLDYTNSLLPRETESRRYYSTKAGPLGQVTVQTTTLDRFCDEQAIGHVDLLKLDIQGAELAAIAGGRGLLSAGTIDVILTEVFFVSHYAGGALYHQVASALEGFGYSLFDLCPAVHASNGQLRYGDAVFVSPRYRTEVLDRAAQEP